MPLRAILARRFLATCTLAPACRICLRRRCIWATVRPEYCATTTTEVFEKTSCSVATASFFSALSTVLSPVGGEIPASCTCRARRPKAADRGDLRLSPEPGEARRRTDGSNRNRRPPGSGRTARNPVFPVYAGPLRSRRSRVGIKRRLRRNEAHAPAVSDRTWPDETRGSPRVLRPIHRSPYAVR